MQRSDPPVPTDVTPVPSSEPKQRPIARAQSLLGPDWLPEARRYLMMRPVVFAGLCVLLLLHWVAASVFDFTTVLLVAGIYAMFVGSGGLDVARLSGSGGDKRRQERLTEDALRRAGRLQSHLEPGSASDAVVTRIMASAHEPRRAVLLAGNEVEDALRAVYRHYAEAGRLAGTSTGADLPLAFLVQELIWRGLLAPDIFDTAEPVLSLRDMALEPRSTILPQTASDCARAAQAIVLRVESLGIEIRPRRTPLAWLRPEPAEDSGEPAQAAAFDPTNRDESGDGNRGVSGAPDAPPEVRLSPVPPLENQEDTQNGSGGSELNGSSPDYHPSEQPRRGSYQSRGDSESAERPPS